MYQVGNLSNNIHKLQGLLKKIGYPTIPAVDLKSGAATIYLPMLNFVFLSYSTKLSQDILDKGIVLANQTDAKFVESSFKIMRDLLHWVPSLKQHQLLSNSFVEQKLIFMMALIEKIMAHTKPTHIQALPRKMKKAVVGDNQRVSSPSTGPQDIQVRVEKLASPSANIENKLSEILKELSSLKKRVEIIETKFSSDATRKDVNILYEKLSKFDYILKQSSILHATPDSLEDPTTYPNVHAIENESPEAPTSPITLVQMSENSAFENVNVADEFAMGEHQTMEPAIAIDPITEQASRIDAKLNALLI